MQYELLRECVLMSDDVCAFPVATTMCWGGGGEEGLSTFVARGIQSPGPYTCHTCALYQTDTDVIVSFPRVLDLALLKLVTAGNVKTICW